MRSLHLQALAHEGLEPPSRAREGIAFRHAASVVTMPLADSAAMRRDAAAGAIAATAWGLLEPLDRRLFRCDYSDIALLGKAVTRGRGWRAAGFAMHAVNGAVFGLVYGAVRRRTALDPRRLAVAMALAEHGALYPLSYFVDRYHPGRGEEGLPPLLTNARAFGQATVRHVLFGLVLGRLADSGGRSG